MSQYDEHYFGHLKPNEKSGDEPTYVGSTHPVVFGAGAATKAQAQDYLDQLLAGNDDGVERDFVREVIFVENFDEETEADRTHMRLVKHIDTATYPDGKVVTNEYLAVERMRPQVGGGYYVRESQALALPASRAGRTELLLKMAAVLGLDARID